jgi:transcriptional regulator with XRE-family HTH domain
MITAEQADGLAVIGDRVYELRKAQKLSQEEVAYRAGVAVKTIANIESGRSARPWRRTSKAIAKALGVTVEDLEQAS